jgi:hypothetical protein
MYKYSDLVDSVPGMDAIWTASQQKPTVLVQVVKET